MSFSALILSLFLQVAVAPGQSAPPPAAELGALPCAVDPRVEFLMAVARNSGFEEYRRTEATSPYSARVDALFAPHLAHPAFESMRTMRRVLGISHDAITSLALHLSDAPQFTERIPFVLNPARLDERFSLDDTRMLLIHLRELAALVDWPAFAKREQSFYEQARLRLAEAVIQTGLRVPGWFDQTLGVKSDASVVVIVGLLAGPMNHGCSVAFADGTPEEIRPLIGCWEWDADGLPVFPSAHEGGLTALLAHELCHSYVNPWVIRHAAELHEVGKRIYELAAAAMKQQSYGSWLITMNETVVRACVLRLLADTAGGTAAAQEMKNDMRSGFIWVPALAAELGRAMRGAEGAPHPTLDELTPVIVQTLAREADRLEAIEARRPRLESSEPIDGATNVAPGEFHLRLQFSTAMNSTSYSVVGAPEDLPTGFELVKVSDDGQSWEFRGTVEAGRSYRIGLNSARFTNFRSTDGGSLKPAVIHFTVEK